MKKFILALIGLPRCGKDLSADFISKNYGFKKINLSDLIAAEAKKRNLPSDKKGLSELGDRLRQEQGSFVMGKLAWKEIKNSKELLFVISGFRSFPSIQYLRKRTNIFVVKIITSKQNRFLRAEESREELEERERIEFEKKGLGKTLKKAHYLIKNDSSIEQFYSKLDKLMIKIKVRI